LARCARTLASHVRYDSWDEVFKLRQKLWNTRRRRSRYAGIAFLSLSVIFLVLTLLTQHLVFEIAFLLSIFIGALLSIRETESYIRLGTASAIVISLFLGLKNLLYEMGVDGRIEFVPLGKDSDKISAQVYSTEREFQFMLELARPLTHIYELELGDLKKLELSDLNRDLPKVIVDGLRLARSIELIYDGNKIEVVVRKPTLWALYLEESLTPIIDRIGCPLSCSIAESIAQCTGRAVFFKGYDRSISEETLKFRYELGFEVE